MNTHTQKHAHMYPCVCVCLCKKKVCLVKVSGVLRLNVSTKVEDVSCKNTHMAVIQTSYYNEPSSQGYRHLSL